MTARPARALRPEGGREGEREGRKEGGREGSLQLQRERQERDAPTEKFK